ncbi:MAG: hypothetical protein R3C26_01780 [Calditrichia bacterium]
METQHPEQEKSIEIIRLLLVDDDDTPVRQLQEKLAELQHIRFEINHESCLADALERLQESVFDLIMVDLSLPDAYGTDVIYPCEPTRRKFPSSCLRVG